MTRRTSLALCMLGLFLGASGLWAGTAPAPVSTDPAAQQLLPYGDLQISFEALSCTVTIDCPYSNDVSCSSPNNQCATSADGQCVICDGQTMDCCQSCTSSCRSKCDSRWMICIEGCFGDPVCEDRCWRNRDICYSSCGC